MTNSTDVKIGEIVGYSQDYYQTRVPAIVLSKGAVVSTPSGDNQTVTLREFAGDTVVTDVKFGDDTSYEKAYFSLSFLNNE